LQLFLKTVELKIVMFILPSKITNFTALGTGSLHLHHTTTEFTQQQPNSNSNVDTVLPTQRFFNSFFH